MGTCCNPRRAPSLILEPNANNLYIKLANIPTPKTIPSLQVEYPYSHCNLLVWTGTEPEFLMTFKQSYYKIQITNSFSMTFNITSYYSYTSTSPISIDCLVFYANTQQDLEIVKILSKKYSNIPVQMLVTDLDVIGLDRVMVVANGGLGMLWNHLFVQQNNLEKLLKDLFNDMDRDQNGFLSNEELYEALQKLNSRLTQADTNRIFQVIDINHRNCISFNEFSYWWKRGRQQKATFQDLTMNLADRINYFLPKMSKNAQNRGVSKKKLAKKITFLLTPTDSTKLSLKLKIAKSGKREHLLRKPERILNLAIHEFWITVVLYAKNQVSCIERLQLVEDMLYYLKFSLLNSQIPEMPELAKTLVQKKENEIWFSVCFNFDNDSVFSVVEKLSSIEKALLSPVDDYLSVVVNSGRSVKEMAKGQKDCFLQSVGSGKVVIEAEHWAGFNKIALESREYSEVLQKFLEFEGETVVRDVKNDPFPTLVEFLQKGFGLIKNLSGFVPIVGDAFDLDPEEFEENLKIYIRYLNIGIKLQVQGEDLDYFINNL